MRTDHFDAAPPIVLKYKNPAGLYDVMPQNLRYWHHAHNLISHIAQSFGYRHIMMPAVDAKSMYTDAFGEQWQEHLFDTGITSDSDTYVLPAHPRIGLMRSYLESGLHEWPPPVRVYYETPVVQKTPSGLAQNHYFCLDCLGVKDMTTSASLLVMLRKIATDLHIKKPEISIHSNGCIDCRGSFRQQFAEHALKHRSELCALCAVSPTLEQVVTCETDSAAAWLPEVSGLLDQLCPNCHAQLATMLEACDELSIPYDIDPSLIIASPEAEQTTFALRVGDESIPAIVGYHFSRFAAQLTDRPIAAVGITIDMPRLSRYLEMHHTTLPDTDGIEIFLAQLGSHAKAKTVGLLQQLYGAGYSVVTASESESITQQLQVAERLNARITLIIGQKEAVNGHVIMRDMASGLQDNVFMEELIPALQERLAVAY